MVFVRMYIFVHPRKARKLAEWLGEEVGNVGREYTTFLSSSDIFTQVECGQCWGVVNYVVQLLV